MPCGDYGYEDQYREYEALIKRLKQVACKLAKIVKAHGLMNDCDGQVRAWIHEHDAEDARRLRAEAQAAERERAIRNAKSKLSLADRKLLGIR